MSELIVTRHGRVLQLTLNRPAARNALNNALLTQLPLNWKPRRWIAVSQPA
jgi:enoyl-CoA hydratase/carnithine racemase